MWEERRGCRRLGRKASGECPHLLSCRDPDVLFGARRQHLLEVAVRLELEDAQVWLLNDAEWSERAKEQESESE